MRARAVQINSHYYSASFDECLYVLLNWPGVWNLETASAVLHPGPRRGRPCPANTLPVYRFFDNRRDANHRYTVDLSVRRAMINRAWAPEGTGATRGVLLADLTHALAFARASSPSSSGPRGRAPPTP